MFSSLFVKWTPNSTPRLGLSQRHSHQLVTLQPRCPSFVPAICQALSCPRVFLDRSLSAGKSSLVHSTQLAGLLQAVCVSMHVDMCPWIREKFVFHMEIERMLLIWEEPALSTNGSSAWHAVPGPSHLPPLPLPSSLWPPVRGWPPGFSKVVPGQMHPLRNNSKNGEETVHPGHSGRRPGPLLVGPDQLGFRGSRGFSSFSSWRVARLKSTSPGSFHGTGVRISSTQDTWLSMMILAEAPVDTPWPKACMQWDKSVWLSTTWQTKMSSSFKYASC